VGVGRVGGGGGGGGGGGVGNGLNQKRSRGGGGNEYFLEQHIGTSYIAGQTTG